MGSYQEHQNLLKKFMLLATKELPNMRIFPRHVGKFLIIRFISDVATRKCKMSDWKRYLISINKKGMADCYGLIKTKYGIIHIEMEVKTGKSVQSKFQKTWEKFIISMNGAYFIIRCEHQAVKEIKDYICRFNIIE